MIEKFTEEELRIIEAELLARKKKVTKAQLLQTEFQRIDDAIAIKYGLDFKRSSHPYTWQTTAHSAIATLTDLATGNAEVVDKGRYVRLKRHNVVWRNVSEYATLAKQIIDCVLEVMQKGTDNE